MYPEQVVTFIKRSIGQPGFSLNLNGIDMKPEEISSYILKKVVKDGGQCVMYPSQTSTIKYKAYNLGGVIANAIIAALSTLLMLPNNFYLLMMMIELVFVGAYKILVNLIPHKTNGVPNDGYIVKMLDAHIAMRKDYALYLRIYADTFLNKAISPSDYQYERNESLSDDELLYYNEIQEILKSINAQMSKHEIDHCKGIVI